MCVRGEQGLELLNCKPFILDNTHNVHEGEKVVLYMLLSMKAHHRVVDAKKHLDVVVIVSGVPASPGCVVHLFGDVVERPRDTEFWLCEGKK